MSVAWCVEVRVGTVGCDRPKVNEEELTAMVRAFELSLVAYLGKKYPLAKGKPGIEFQNFDGSWTSYEGGDPS